jgi:putative transposase
LSVSAVNQITLNVQRQLEAKRQMPLPQTPEMILVDGVWVEIQYTIADEFKEDQSGHLRQCRRAEERVVFAVMAIWADGSQELPRIIHDTNTLATKSRLFFIRWSSPAP